VAAAVEENGGWIVRHYIHRTVIQTVGDDHRTLICIVSPTVAARLAKGGGRTVGMTVETGVEIRSVRPFGSLTRSRRWWFR
jgi:hypothetical protein